MAISKVLRGKTKKNWNVFFMKKKCGCYCKIISKLLAERMKKVIDKVVGEEQNAFIKGRFILDGGLIANEALDYLKKNRKKVFLLKIDFEKAYDSVNWNFIRQILIQMGFGVKWCKWIKACQKSALISILVNGSPTVEFKMEMGLDKVEQFASRMGCLAGNMPFTYLGMPVGCNMKRIKFWEVIEEKLTKRLGNWNAKTLSFGGRLTLVKSVLSSLPLYYFSLFRALMGVLKKLESMRQRFFWGKNDECKNTAWVKWDLALNKANLGGLNIGSLKASNWALLDEGLFMSFESRSNRLSRSIWGDIVRVGKDIDKTGINFCLSSGKMVGNRLETNKDESIGEKRVWGEEVWEWQWNWAREPRGRG
ncbi:RNA-directed DNA polymerase, eukaryota, reverse transcriptase zinc-binding domain protein [Tanacetum coccineum]